MAVNELLQAIRERRSIRRFEDRAIAPELMAEIFEAARWAPSWGNSQCCEIVVVDDRGDKERLAAMLSPKNPASLAVCNAPVVLAVAGRQRTAGYYHGEPKTLYGDWLMHDLGLVTQNICLAAHVLGLGTVIVGSFDHRQAAELLAIPESCSLVSLIPLGYPAHAPSPPERKSLQKFIHYRRF